MENLEEVLRQQREELHKLESLVAHKGWELLMKIADGQVELREPGLFEPLKNLLEVGPQEYDKGVIQGIKLFKVIPHNRISDLKERAGSLEKEIENDRNRRASPTAGGESGTDSGGFEPPSP